MSEMFNLPVLSPGDWGDWNEVADSCRWVVADFCGGNVEAGCTKPWNVWYGVWYGVADFRLWPVAEMPGGRIGEVSSKPGEIAVWYAAGSDGSLDAVPPLVPVRS